MISSKLASRRCNSTSRRGFSTSVARSTCVGIRERETAAQLIARVTEDDLARLLDENADEPHANLIARMLKEQPIDTTHTAERILRSGLSAAVPRATKADVKMSVRRTFQALRIAVNDEFSALDALLRVLPHCLAPGGRVAMLTFHSGEDRRVRSIPGGTPRRDLFSSGDRGDPLRERGNIREPARSAAKLRGPAAKD